MSVVGSLIFCTSCGNLLDSITAKNTVIKCVLCRSEYPSKKFENLQVITQTAENAFPSTLRSSKKSVVKTTVGDTDTEGATIREKCPQCGNDEMKYQTLQLRSADEGATVFYTCTKCNYKFRTNN